MIRQTIAVAFLSLFLAACGGAVSQIHTVEGLVIEVVSDSPVDLEEFTLRTDQGEQLRFSLRDVGFAHGGFPTTHLREHQALAEPVRVTYRVEGAINVVVRLEDAE